MVLFLTFSFLTFFSCKGGAVLYIVSACLAGIKCRYDGRDNTDERVKRLVEEGKAVPVCPEVLGGLSIPRTPCEIIMNNGNIKVINKNGEDCTEKFLEGSKKTLAIAKVVGAKKAILKSKSPSCGNGKIYDGSFSGILTEGKGITTGLLLNNGIKVYTEKDLTEKELKI